jgi:Hint domain
VFVDGVLIPIRHLVNGTTVAQEQVDEITYWHVELESHDVIMAEGLPCESYLDTGNRGAFENGGAPVQLHPDFARWRREASACAPLVVTGPNLEQVRAGLAGRAVALTRERRAAGFGFGK